MLKYTIQRFLLMLMTLFIITLMCFVLIRMLPPVPLDANNPSSQVILLRREALGYNKPYLVQFGIFLKDIFTRFDWGVCEVITDYGSYGQPIIPIFMEKLPPTMLINLYSILFSIPIGIALGIWAALKKNTWIDHTISTLTMMVVSVPSFVYAFLIQYFMYFKWGWFDRATLALGTDWFSWPMFKSMLMPIMSLAFGTIAGFTRTTRAELTEVLTSEFMLLARTKGLTRAQATVRHAMKNCLVVILPAIFGNFIGILSGSLIIEKIFVVPGVGGLYLSAINAQDYPMFMLLTVFYTAIGLTAGIVVDVSYGFIDPRIRMGSRK